MHKAIPFNATATQDLGATTGRVLPFPGTADRGNRTSVCAVLFLDIVEYSKRPVSEQLQIKERFNAFVAEAINDIPVDERIVLDTGDGVAITLLGDPEDALFVAMNLMAALLGDASAQPLRLRGGINLGPVRLMRDINSQPNIIGDGINVAQRVMSFANPGTVLVSRSYYEVVTRICEDYAQLFEYHGARTDKHVREHELYEVVSPTGQASELTRLRSHARHAETAIGANTQLIAMPTSAGLLSNRNLAIAITGVAILALVAAAIPYLRAPAVGASAREPAVAAPTASSPAAAASPLAPAAVPASGAAQPQAPALAAASPQRAPNGAPVKSVEAAPAAAPAPPRDPALIREPVAVGTPREPATTTAALSAEPARSITTKSASPPGASALVLMAISPWGEVFVNGKSVGVSPPLTELELSPGAYHIEVRNGTFRPYEEEVRLGSNETIRIKHKFSQKR